jgi:hypothetical protein
VYFEPVGDTGWVKISITRTQFIDTTIQYWRFDPLPGNTYTLWNPTLRYGDWVSLEKNWLTANDISAWGYNATNGQRTPSLTHAPDGTLSAYDFASITTLDTGMSSGFHTIPTTGGAWTYEFWVNHAESHWDDGKIYFYMRSSAGWTERVYLRLNLAGGSTFFNTIQTNGPGYTLADHVQQEAIGSDGWWRYRITLFDYANNAITSVHYWYVLDAGSAGRSTIWNPRLTVGNPADMLDYFVSGPQNLLGDGSDYSHWLTGTSPRDVPITANTAVAPNGRLEADTLTHTTGVAGWDYRAKVKPVTAGITTTYSYYFKTDASLPTSASEQVWVRYQDSGGVQIESIKVDISYSGNNAITAFVASTTGGPGYVSGDVIITPISNDWVRVEFSLTDYSSTAVQIFCVHYSRDFSPSGTDYDVTLWGSEITTITPKTPV